MKKAQQINHRPSWGHTLFKIVGVIFVIWLLAIFFSIFFGVILLDSNIVTESVAIIPIKGIITSDSSDGLFTAGGASSSDIIRFIDKAEENPRVQAIVFEINSPGGSAVASDEIATRIKKAEKPTVAWIREVGASGAYWSATATDHIVANRMSIVGSIGVISSYLEFSEFLKEYNVSYTRLVAGDHKDIGTPFKELTSFEKQFLETQLETIHDIFIQEVADNRGMTFEETEKLSDGLFYLGIQGVENGLVDEVGGIDEVTMYLNRTYNISATYGKYQKKESLFGSISTSLSKLLPNTIENQKYINENIPVIST